MTELIKPNSLFDSEMLNASIESIMKQKKKRGDGTSPKKREKNIQKLAIAFVENRSEKNFNLLCERINWGLRGYIFKIVKDDGATTDVMSRTLENIYFKIDQFDPSRGNFSTWMYKIARNNALKYNKDSTKFLTVGVDYEDLYDATVATEVDTADMGDRSIDENICDIVYTNGSWQTFDKEQVLKEFYDASVSSIEDLPDNLRIVMRDRLVGKKKIEDIAYDNKIPITSVKNWLRKGKTELQGIIRDKYPRLYEMYREIA